MLPSKQIAAAPCSSSSGFLCGLDTTLTYVASVVTTGVVVGYLVGGPKHRVLGGILGMLAGYAVAGIPPVRHAIDQSAAANPWLGARLRI